MARYTKVPTWNQILTKTTALEKGNLSNFNNKNGTKFKNLYQVMDYLYSDASVSEGFASRDRAFYNTINEFLEKDFINLLRNPVVQQSLFDDAEIILKGQLAELDTSKVSFSGKDFKFTHLRNQIAREAKTYFNNEAKLKYNKVYGIKGKNSTLNQVKIMEKGKILELTITDTMSEVYGGDNVALSRERNAPFDFSIYELPMEVKANVDNFRYMDKAPSKVSRDILKNMRDQAMSYYKRNTFDAWEYKTAFVRALVDYKMMESNGATFMKMNRSATQYLLASDFIKDLATYEGEPILNHNKTVVNMDDIYDVLATIKKRVKNQVSEPINYRRNRTTSLWYGAEDNNTRYVTRQQRMHF